MSRAALVLGLGVTGRSLVAALHQRGWEVEVADDRPSEESRARATELGVVVHETPDAAELARLARAAELVVVSPGIPPSHPVFSIPGVEPISEVELGSRWTEPDMVAVTGTNGKTTVVTLITLMLEEAGRKALSAGNIGFPLVEAAGHDAEWLVVEVSSFQLAYSYTFHPRVSVWLNLAADHLDWHPDMDHYAASKARIWANQGEGDTIVVNAVDPRVMEAVAGAPRGTSVVTFGGDAADWRRSGPDLHGPDGAFMRVEELPRSLPHDIDNALAATAAAVAAGAGLDTCRDVLRRFEGLPHRVSFVLRVGEVDFYDDSKATTPASVLAALAGFDSVVLLAGGQNKGMDMAELTAGADRIRAVVAIGAAGPEVEAAFRRLRPVTTASTMDEAVTAAVAAARPGDVVLLSPGCASYDWYRSYAERGDDFVRAVRSLAGAAS